jgi:energy-coupling factor transport system permease protein
MPVLEYEAGSTLFHKMGPLSKFLWGFIVILWLFLTFNPLHVFLLGVAIVIVAKVGAGISVRRLMRTSLLASVGGIFIIAFQGLLHVEDHYLWQWGPIHVSGEGLSTGLAIALRIVAIIAASAVIAKTSDPRDVFLALIKIGVPYTIAYGLFAAIRFIPLMEYEAETIQEAQMVRGIAKKKGGLKSTIATVQNFLVPFIASGVRRAQQSAVALDVRGFGLYPTRTYLRTLKADRAGMIFAGVWALALVLYILFMQANIFGSIFFEPNIT